MPGQASQWRAGVQGPQNSLTPPEIPIIPRQHSSSHGAADISVHSGASTAGGSGHQPSGISNAAPFSAPPISHQRNIPDQVLDGQLDDSPYVPPRIPQAEIPPYPALDPRLGNVYDPRPHDIPQVRAFTLLFEID